MVRHPEEYEASQLGWHPTEAPSYGAFSIRSFIKGLFDKTKKRAYSL